jgi:hypothetical protein
MADDGVTKFLLEQLERFTPEQLRAHLIKEGHDEAVVDEAMAAALAIRSAPEGGFFAGRMPRSTFGLFCLGGLIVEVLARYLPGPAGGLLALVGGLAVVVAAVPRIHDLDRTGWWTLMMVIPALNIALLIGLLARPGTDGPNDYGPPPG